MKYFVETWDEEIGSCERLKGFINDENKILRCFEGYDPIYREFDSYEEAKKDFDDKVNYYKEVPDDRLYQFYLNVFDEENNDEVNYDLSESWFTRSENLIKYYHRNKVNDFIKFAKDYSLDDFINEPDEYSVQEFVDKYDEVSDFINEFEVENIDEINKMVKLGNDFLLNYHD